MKAAYFRAMDVLHKICLVVACGCIVVLTLIIPWGVFTRYVLHAASSWPEPMAVLLMVLFTFFAAALCYRENLHITVNILPNLLHGRAATVHAWIREILMGGANLFMLVYGIRLVETTWHHVIAEFPVVSVGVSYLPIPVGGSIIALFVVERLLRGGVAPAAAQGQEGR